MQSAAASIILLPRGVMSLKNNSGDSTIAENQSIVLEGYVNKSKGRFLDDKERPKA